MLHETLVQLLRFMYDESIILFMYEGYQPHLAKLDEMLLQICKVNDKYPYFLRASLYQLAPIWTAHPQLIMFFKQSFVYICSSREIRGLEASLRLHTPNLPVFQAFE
jgi:hypothetical protein